MRYAYIKYGDVVEESRIAAASPEEVPKGGPDTFTASFLKMVCNDPVLLISWGWEESHYKTGSIEAHTYKRPIGFEKALGAIKIFNRLVRFKPDAVLCVQDGPGLWATSIACRWLNIPLIHSRQRAIRVKGDPWHRRVTAAIDGQVIRRAAGVICHGPFTHRQLREIGVPEDKIVEFDVAVDDIKEGISNSVLELEAEKTTSVKTILFLGRIEESKGVFDLLKACIPILNSREDISIVYVGDGGALSHLRRYVEKEGLNSRVRFTGRVPHKEIGRQLKAATVLVTPTRRGLEGRSMVVLEGLAMGTPVIAPNAGPFPLVIEDGVNGLLFECDSIQDLRTKIENVLNDPGLRRKLSQGALATEERRSLSMVSFADALTLAFERWVASK